MKITISAFAWVPPFAQGVVRDLRVRWALEEAGLPYDVRLLTPKDQKTAEYKQLQQFGQVPIYQEDDLTLFESGAIVLHIAEKTKVLMPESVGEKARMTTWMFAALNSIEPGISELAIIDIFCAGEEWSKLRRPGAVEFVEKRLKALSDWLGEKDYLEGRFTAADLIMTTVLRNLRHTEIVATFPNLKAYQNRCEARPAFQKALADQMRTFKEHAPKESKPH